MASCDFGSKIIFSYQLLLYHYSDTDKAYELSTFVYLYSDTKIDCKTDLFASSSSAKLDHVLAVVAFAAFLSLAGFANATANLPGSVSVLALVCLQDLLKEE